MILQSASSLSMVMIFVGLGIASMIAGFFIAVIFYTLLAALLFVLIVFFALWILHEKNIAPLDEMRLNKWIAIASAVQHYI